MIPDSVTDIGYGAFNGCASLTDVYYKGSEAEWAKISIGSNNDKLTGANITYNYGIVFSEGLAFYSNGDGTCSVTGIGTCTDTDIVIPPVSPDGDKVIAIGAYAFEFCKSLTSVTIPDVVTTIRRYAFFGCTNLQNITVPDSITKIEMDAFTDTGYYKPYINWDSHVMLYIGNHFIEGAHIVIASTFDVKEGTLTIADRAFARCEMIYGVKIPGSVTNIGYNVFGSCKMLKHITVDETNSNYQSIDGNLYTKDGKTLIKYAVGKTDTSFTILDDVTAIDGWAFSYGEKLTSVTIGSNVTSIGEYAFLGCSNLTSITIPNSVTSIADNAFKDCDSLTDVYFTGSEEEWAAISIGWENENLTGANIIFNCVE